MTREIYLDNSATTKPFASVRTIMDRALEAEYGNPSALYRKGLEAEQLVREAQRRIASSLRASENEILFTSGGTESDNLALMGTAFARRRLGSQLITTAVEHPAVLRTMEYLQTQGFQVTILPVDSRGVVRLEDLARALTKETILVSMMLVNNEVGAVQPVEEAAALIHEKAPLAYFHVDAVQGYGKYRIRPKQSGIDLLAVSGHKIHGPKGVGFLYVRDGVNLQPILWGGGQQRGLRSGTENVPGIAGLGQAAVDIYQEHEVRTERLYQLRERLTERLLALPDTLVNGPRGQEGAPHIVSASFPGIRSEVLLHALEEKGIYVSSGSACASHHPGVSSTLAAMHLPKSSLESTLRFSLSIFTTQEEIDETADAVEALLPVCRRYIRR